MAALYLARPFAVKPPLGDFSPRPRDRLGGLLFLFGTGLTGSGEAGSDGLLLGVSFLHHLADVRRNRLFGGAFFEGHDYSPFILVVYFLPRQVKVFAPEVRADLNA